MGTLHENGFNLNDLGHFLIPDSSDDILFPKKPFARKQNYIKMYLNIPTPVSLTGVR